MSSFLCSCGARIADVTDHLPYKGTILPDTRQEKLFDRLVELVNGLTDSIRNNSRQRFVEKQGFRLKYEWDDGSLLFDLFMYHYRSQTKQIYQCQTCGRVLIQKGDSTSFVAFKPESEDWKYILSDLG